MSITRIASRYAKSLLDLTEELGTTDQVLGDIKGLQTAVKNRDLFLMLKSPIINPDKKGKVLHALFDDKMGKTTLSFLDIILSKGREQYIPEIATEFEVLYKRQNQISNVEITTATELSDAAFEEITKKLLASVQTEKSIEMVKKVDPEILGGFVVKIGDKLYDASVQNKLDRLRKEFSGNDYVSKI